MMASCASHGAGASSSATRLTSALPSPSLASVFFDGAPAYHVCAVGVQEDTLAHEIACALRSRRNSVRAYTAIGYVSLAHPAAPAMVRRGDEVWVYIHESVPGASVDAYLPKALYRSWSNREDEGRVARYALPASALEKWTRRQRRSLQKEKPS